MSLRGRWWPWAIRACISLAQRPLLCLPILQTVFSMLPKPQKRQNNSVMFTQLPVTNKTISQDETKRTGHVFSTPRLKAVPGIPPMATNQVMKFDSSVSYDTPRMPLPPRTLSESSSESESGTESESGSEKKDEESPESTWRRHKQRNHEFDLTSSQVTPLAAKLAEELRCRLINSNEPDTPGNSVSSRVTENLIWTISQLQVENEILKTRLEEARENDSKASAPPEAHSNDTQTPSILSHETLHEVIYSDTRRPESRKYYRDVPRMFKGDTKKDIPRGAVEVEDVSTYLQNHTNLAFIVLEVYRFDAYIVGEIFEKVGGAGGTLHKDYCSVEKASRDIYVSASVEGAINSIVKAYPERFPGFERLSSYNTSWHEPPYTFFYLHHSTLMEFLSGDTLNELEKQNFRDVLEWMENNARADWDEADDLFAQGKVNSKHYAKLFRPGELVVWPNYGGKGTMRATMVNDFPHFVPPAHRKQHGFSIITHLWGFNGKFTPDVHNVRLDLEESLNAGSGYKSDDEVVDILRLSEYPLRFAEDGLRMKLIARGEKFWQLRRKTLVCIKENSEDSYQAERRCMIDYTMYKRLHPAGGMYTVREEAGWMETRPEDSNLACLPSTILGFDFSKKTWRELRVDSITHVTWNKAAFKQLVAPEETKELVMAMVTEHGQWSSATIDIIEGKGQGLLMLLHGGPGTGKTLTAESIAELQERPLYRVTCGDIGIEPKEVEQYLGDVLELGRSWGCVVLLDEADVFLEERSFTDQKRNAVISIFLRVLEYYDGILILTTNRVGSFDEAFKSRIQLALAYPRLNEEDRLKIWNNFMQMLPRSGERVDMADLRLNLPKLARVDINGRQIRNVVTMARHLAKYRKEMLRAEHMQDAMRSVERFNEYLSDVKGIQDDERARGLTLR
ncbi:hypothetical protein B0J13DRAFT_43347 [Dactylonectria estremocensis]|uniref:AAA+ ATPase domain-containing protein n=1 Tax=Dactylonectria estremocensis TaxID=1079267 RepID=A0A9P9J196_9HYPO|nr:hypothetical protein B0J13DRAFT_43347 [Dactylonectria estremocensis]